MSHDAAAHDTENVRAKLDSESLAKTPRITRWASRSLFASILVLPFALVFLPWTQTVHGTGKAIAFNPVQRPQFLVSPIEGRVKKWHVVEGDRVRAGQRIVEMVDNDPNLELRLLDEERAILDRMRAAEGRVLDIDARIRNLENSRELALAVQGSILRQEQARVQSTKEEILEAQAVVDAAEPNYRRQKELFDNPTGGLASKRDVEVALQTLETARAKLNQGLAKLKLANAAERAAADNLRKIDADTAAMINLENASRRSAQSEVAGVRRDKAQIEVRIARQRAQYVDAPVDGVIFRLLANAEQGGQLVRPGERLAVLVPDIKSLTSKQLYDFDYAQIAEWVGFAAMPTFPGAMIAPAVSITSDEPLTIRKHPGIVAELFVDGNDLPLLRKGDRVRLQFEGWPAVQFVGWPSVAIGTFGGKVHLVDPTANEKGQFRLLVEPDPDEAPWPNQDFLRQGVRTQGWVLLNEVRVGWELWRQLNGFPPFREMKDGKTGQPLGPVKRK
jgi:adhesin transport system membrane fusion protein